MNVQPRILAPRLSGALGSLTGGGTDGNEQLTTVTGLILIVLLAAIGFTIPQLRQFIWMHLFVGFLLIGPVLLKVAATGYRFVRYYAHDPAYRSKGPPEIVLRLIAPIVVPLDDRCVRHGHRTDHRRPRRPQPDAAPA